MKKYLKLLLVLFFLILAIGLLYKIASSRSSSTGKSGLKIIASFYPTYFFSKEVAKEYADVINITPAGAEPHDFEPNAADIVKIEKSNLLVLSGAGLEPWGDKVESGLKDKNVKVIKVAENLATREIIEEGEKSRDPHVWLDPVLAKEEVQKITDALKSIDPANTKVYDSNSKNIKNRLDILDSDFKKALSSCSLKDIVTSHTAFGYLAARYGLNQVSITGLTPDDEPSPSRLAEIANFAKARDVKYIFFESLVEPRLSETIAKEIGAKTIVFNPLEGLTKEEEKNGKDYFSIQRENLENLKIALNCK